MPHFYKTKFLKEGTKATTTHDSECSICYLPFPDAGIEQQLTRHVKDTRFTARGLLRHSPKIEGSEYTKRMRYAAIQIKKCGHHFCTSCLNTWLVGKNTCPMCRDVLFFNDGFFYDESRSFSSRAFLEIRDIGEPAARSTMSESVLESETDHQGCWSPARPSLLRGIRRHISLVAMSLLSVRTTGTSWYEGSISLEGIEDAQWKSAEEVENEDNNNREGDDDRDEMLDDENGMEAIGQLHEGAMIWRGADGTLERV